MAELEVLTWPAYADAARDLARMVADDGYRPDLILAIARGGLLIAGSVSYALGVKNLHVINVEYYTGVNERLDFPVILPPPLNLVDLAAARLLVVDDVADTGHTLALVRDFCLPQVAELPGWVVVAHGEDRSEGLLEMLAQLFGGSYEGEDLAGA